jgi:hypothetical protein
LPARIIVVTASDQALDHLPQPHERVARIDRNAAHVGEHRDSHLDADARDESDEDRARQEIGQEAEIEHPGKQQHRGRQQRHHADQREVMRAARQGHVAQRTGENRRRRRIGRDHQMTRGAEGREGHDRQQHRVEPADHGRARDPRITQHLGDVDGGDAHAGDQIAHHALAGQGPESGEEFHDVRGARAGVAVTGGPSSVFAGT